jgi:antitoxin VapB
MGVGYPRPLVDGGIVWDISFVTVAKVFMNGRSQAIRLPLEFRVASREVHLKKTAEGFLVMERDPWDVFVEGCRELPDGFGERRTQPPLESRERLG